MQEELEKDMTPKLLKVLDMRYCTEKSKNTSGFVGVHWNKPNKNWVVSISFNNIKKHIGSFPTAKEAVQARDNYIIENKLPHKLSTDYIKDNK